MMSKQKILESVVFLSYQLWFNSRRNVKTSHFVNGVWLKTFLALDAVDLCSQNRKKFSQS